MTTPREPTPPPAQTPATPAPPADRTVQTRHQLTIGDQVLEYTVTTGTIILHEESEKQGDQAGVSEGEQPRASVFFTAYTLDSVGDVSGRPITFAFNGGPGSASVWLHLGILGPRRVLMDDEGRAPPPPYRLVPNQHTLLQSSDLVFIDPVSTGYSRPIPGEKAKRFHSFEKHIESVGDFIRLYTTRNGRWSSPKYLAGESYGTTRAAGLSGYLQNRHGMYLNGLILVSAVLNFQTLEFHVGNDLPYILFVPTYAATAWYHKRLRPELQRRPLRELLDEVEEFSLGEYATALMRGTLLPANERQRIARKLGSYIGLSTDYLVRSDLRVRDSRFFKELLRADERTVGRLDSRFIGADRDSLGETFEYDPSMSAILGPYTACLYQYVRGELGFESDLPYEVLSERVYPWSYSTHENRYVDVAETLRQAFATNPALRVYIANGYYDLATPHFATEYTLSHLGISAEQRRNIQMSYFEGGHMMYLHLPSLERLGVELASFVSPE
jgi:carboxypeptidase C (cathepsin A)